MHRVIAVALATFLVGCNQRPGTLAGATSPATAPSPAASSPPTPQMPGVEVPNVGLPKAEAEALPSIPAELIPAGKWNRSEIVSYYVKDKLKLQQIRLYDVADNGFGGTGRGRDGNEYSFTIECVKGGLVCQYHQGGGGSGNFSFAEPKL